MLKEQLNFDIDKMRNLYMSDCRGSTFNWSRTLRGDIDFLLNLFFENHFTTHFKHILNILILMSIFLKRGKFDFYHHFVFSTIFLKRIIFKKMSKIMNFPFRFCKIGPQNTLYILGRKNGLFCKFVRFWIFFSNCSKLDELRKMLSCT